MNPRRRRRVDVKGEEEKCKMQDKDKK